MGWSRQPAAAQFRVHWQAQGQGAAASVRLVRCRRRTSALIFAMDSMENTLGAAAGLGSVVALDAGRRIRDVSGAAAAGAAVPASGMYARTARGSASRLASHSPIGGRASAASFE